MKKLIIIGKVFLLTALFVLGTANICFADVYISPVEKFRSISGIPIVIEIVLMVIFLISVICMLIGKLGKIEDLLNRSKKVSENIFYYFIFIIGLCFAIISYWALESYSFLDWLTWEYMKTFEKILMTLIALLPLPCLILSLCFRFFKSNTNNKKISYIILVIYLIFMIFIKLFFDWMLI